MTFTPNLDSSWLELVDRRILINTTGRNDLVGTSHTFTVTSTLDDDTATTDSNYSFTINFEADNSGCSNVSVVTSFTAPPSPESYTYKIASG